MAWHDGRVLIVGGGIAGLSLASGLLRAGFACEVVEQAPRFAAVGAGIALGVNAMMVLRRLGLAEAVVERGEALREVQITDAGGRVLGRTDFAALEPRFGPSVALHRAELHEVLAAAAQGASLRMGATVDALEEDGEEIHARFSDGGEGVYGLVVGADGLRSRVRELVFGRIEPRYAGYTNWRLVVERPPGSDRAVEMWGHGLRFGVVPIAASRVYCYAVANAPAGASDPEEGRVERFRRRFSGFGGPAPAVVEQVNEPAQLLHNDICEVVHEPWHRGGVVLVGDAAHAATPDMGQGAAMALEDVAVLAEMLAERTELASTLSRWATRRRRRVRWVQNQSRRIGRIAQWSHPLACRLRDAFARAVPDGSTTRAVIRLAEQEL